MPPPADFVTCEEVNACSTSGSTSNSGDETPTTSEGVNTVTGDSADGSSSTTAADESGADTFDTTGEPAEPPLIVTRVVMPDYTAENALLDVSVTAENAEGVRMLLENGDEVELTPAGPGEFSGGIEAYTGLGNGKHTAIFTPWRNVLVGESKGADYVIALPPPGSESGWQIDGPGGRVAAIAVLPDGRPVELGTYQEMGTPHCYLHLRDKHGKSVEFVDVLPAYCRAIDLKIDRASGKMHVLVEREMGDEIVWWAGEIAGWGKGPKNIGIGAVGDTAFALAARPDVVAVCGSRAVATLDKLDALAVLLRPGELPEPRVFDYRPDVAKHTFRDTVRDCALAGDTGDTLVLVGEANGQHHTLDKAFRDRLILIESDVTTTAEPVWTVAGIELGVQTRALALDIDEQGRLHLVGDKCNDVCEPDGALWTYDLGGELVDHASIGPLGSSWFGPHDIAWSPAGYAVVAFGEMQGQSLVFKVQAFAPGDPVPLWTFLGNAKQGLQLALAAAVGPNGEVYVGGVAVDDQPAFKRIGG